MSDEAVKPENAEVVPPVVEGSEAAPEANAGEPAAEPKPEKKDGFQKAIDRQTRKYYQEKARADALEAQIRQGGQGNQVQSDPNATPERDKYTTEDEYLTALVDHRAGKIADAKLAQQRQAEAANLTKSKWDKDAAAVRKDTPEFDDIFQDFIDSGHLTPAVDRAVLESDRPAAVVKYLHENPDEAEKIATLSDFRVAIEIGKIEAKLTAPTKKMSSAPAPIAPIGGKGAVGEIDPEKESPSEYAARRNKEVASKRRS